MHGEDLTQEELEALLRVETERAFDARIIAELERVPDLTAAIPEDFAAKVAAQVPAKKVQSARTFAAVRTTHYGQFAMWAGLAVLLVLTVFASRGSLSVVSMTVEALLFMEFAAIAVWLALRSWREG